MALTISFAPITTRLYKRVFPQRNVWTGAAECVELAPSATVYSPQPVSLPNESSRALATMAHTTVKAMRTLEVEGERVHGATLAYRYDNALLADGSFYSNWRYANGVPARRRRAVVIANATEFVEAQLSTDMSSELYFGHWLCDGLCTELLAFDRGLPSLVYEREPRLHEPGYRELLGIHSNHIRVARVSRLWVVDDRGINPARGERFQRLRSRLRKSVGAPAVGSRKIFIARGRGGVSRELVNEDAVVEALTRNGFEVIDPMVMEPRAIANCLGEASIVVGVEGSHQSHAMLAMPPGGALITIEPPDRFLHSWKYFCELSGVRYGFVVADPHPGGFILEPERLLRTLDLLE